MARRIATGIDIGTYQIKVVIAEYAATEKGRAARILGTGFAESKGLRHGYIINSSDVIRSLRSAVHQAEHAANMRIRRAFLAVGGIGLDEMRATGEAIISRGDLEVTDLDTERALEDSEERIAGKILNRKILHTIPLSWKLDGANVIGRAVGMKGNKLEVETLFVTTLEQHLNDLIQAVEDAGVEVDDVMAAPLAGSMVMLTKAQKIAGVLLANIGAETVSIAVFENNSPISVKVFQIGSTDITNDIALGLRISLEEAEQIKRGGIIGAQFPKKKFDEIVLARLTDIFELIETHLKKMNRSGLLPAGIVLTGGGSGIATIEDMARAALKLPSKTSSLPAADPKIKDSTWAVAYGLTIWGLTAHEGARGIRIARRTGHALLSWLKQFLP